MPFKPEYPGDYPTLGYYVLDWIEENLATPDRLDYQPLRFTQEQAEFVLKFYELDPVTGKRIIRRGVISRPRGWGKSPMLSALALVEGLADVVPDGWDARGQPVGKPWYEVRRPLVAVAAATEEQTGNAWAPLLDMVAADAPVHDNYPGLEPLNTRINLPYGHIQTVFSSPTSTKGMPTTFVLMDQTEQWVSAESKKLFTVLKNNTAKRGGAFIESPNAFIPGAGSIAESSAKAFFAQREGRSRNTKGLLYDHREAPGATDLWTRKSLLEGLRIAYGDSSAHPDGCVIHDPPCEPGWVDLDHIIQSAWDEDADEQESRADFLNQITQASDAWIGQTEWAACAASVQDEPVMPVKPGDTIVLGFDGSRGRAKAKPDATALIGCRVVDGHVFRLGIWEASENKNDWDSWEPPIYEIEQLIDETFKKYRVAAFFADPGKDWRSHINSWEAKYGRKTPVKMSRNHPFEWWMAGGSAKRAEVAIEDCESAIRHGDLTHDGSSDLTRHVLNAKRRMSHRHLALSKDSHASPRKIDGAVAMVVAWAARREALSRGLGQKRPGVPPRRIR
ncbi:hypothetical protein QDX21_07105 [Auritidibacter ignavus]|uniref:Terminase n=1 Tax=Auritidibacter ignavus TaxID=678932 RepID=A0AAJ6AF45_9MICC|nr:hypothetical protein [Auritidibacter ignavus]WGH92103.1 hypothetical protein QDX21_07105 [Auritidibacter ignavus]